MNRAEEASRERPITTEGQLLVEGRVPEMFFREMATAYNLQKLIEVRTFGDISKDNLQAYLEIFTQKSTFKQTVKRLGIIRDAEDKPAASAFASVQAALQGAQLPVPANLNELQGNPVSTGVFILPDCTNPGMLETLCLTAFGESEHGKPNAVSHCVEGFFACLDKQDRKPSNIHKSRFAGFALAHDVVDPQLGRAAQKGIIPWQTPAFEPLKLFLHKIAGQ